MGESTAQKKSSFNDSGPRNADRFRADLHPDLKADFVPVRKDLANPPFNMSDWGGEHLRSDVRVFSLSASNGERAGVRCRVLFPPVNNANYAWIQHFLHHLAALRDALLPKLLSGELRVPTTAKITEGVA
jgi:type I restriction-modification system DNA methylase subunit